MTSESENELLSIHFKGKCLPKWFTETGAVTQSVIKGHKIVVYGATLTCKNRGTRSMKGGPWTWSIF